MKTLHYAGFQPEAKGFGWATANANLRSELGKLFTLGNQNPDCAFVPVVDHDLTPCEPITGDYPVIGYAFFEYPLGEKAAENAKKYDTLFVGSTWCLDRLKERGIHNGKVLIQGVDHEIFKPRTPATILHADEIEGSASAVPLALNFPFRIFSGGKFEWRKGQDLVIAAFAQFAKTHPDAHLVCAWHNNWPQLLLPILSKMGITFDKLGECSDTDFQSWLFGKILEFNGIPRDRFTILPQLSQHQLAAEMQNTDVGLFPNRCEGGTNLVLMEYAACGGGVIANIKTGHMDVALAIDFPIRAKLDEQNWAVQTVEDIVSQMEVAYSSRTVQLHKWNPGTPWTWEAAARTVAEEVERVTAIA